MLRSLAQSQSYRREVPRVAAVGASRRELDEEGGWAMCRGVPNVGKGNRPYGPRDTSQHGGGLGNGRPTTAKENSLSRTGRSHRGSTLQSVYHLVEIGSTPLPPVDEIIGIGSRLAVVGADRESCVRRSALA